MLEIDEEKQVYANRLFQCLAISVRPLRVEELAELFAVLPNAESTPGFDVGWRPEDPEAFILSACSTLVTIINTEDGTIVQFSHFSVKEYLTSDRIANSTPVSHFQVLPKPAHTLLARACLGVLLQLDSTVDHTMINENFPLAWYAAKHWVDHARFEDVSSGIGDGIDLLFDKDKPYFAAWLSVYDIDHMVPGSLETAHPKPAGAVPLYYAVLCGLRGLVERLLSVHPQDVNAEGGIYGTPIIAALDNGHLDIALLLAKHGADGGKHGKAGRTGLYIASSHGYIEIVQALASHGVNLDVKCNDSYEGVGLGFMMWTPLHVASFKGRLEVARVLLEYGANVDFQDDLSRTPLQIASRRSYDDLIRLFLDYGANPNASDWRNETALHEASYDGKLGVVRVLLEYGLDVNARSKWGWNPLHNKLDDIYSEGWTPLHYAATWGPVEVVQLLLDHGADVNAPDSRYWTALHLAAFCGRLQVVSTLLRRGANPRSRAIEGNTPFEVTKKHPSWASSPHHLQIAQLLSEHTGESE